MRRRLRAHAGCRRHSWRDSRRLQADARPGYLRRDAGVEIVRSVRVLAGELHHAALDGAALADGGPGISLSRVSPFDGGDTARERSDPPGSALGQACRSPGLLDDRRSLVPWTLA